MNKDQEIMFFLGRLKGYIEWASFTSQKYKNGQHGIFELMADIEQYFNEGLREIFQKDIDSKENIYK